MDREGLVLGTKRAVWAGADRMVAGAETGTEREAYPGKTLLSSTFNCLLSVSGNWRLGWSDIFDGYRKRNVQSDNTSVSHF